MAQQMSLLFCVCHRIHSDQSVTLRPL